MLLREFIQPCIRLLAAVAAAMTPCTLLAQDETYLRGALAVDWSQDASVRDSNCSSTTPPALFGCAVDASGRPLAARGDFGRSHALELAIGHRVTTLLRVEGMLQYRDDVGFEGQANFLGVTGAQPVGGDGSALGGFAVLYADIPLQGRLRPYAGLGLGVSYNRLDGMRYGFPGLGATAATLTPSGSELAAAWLLGIGASLPVGDNFDLDVAWRYSDLGTLRSDAGDATIIRHSGTRVIRIDATEAELRSQGVVLSLRYRF